MIKDLSTEYLRIGRTKDNKYILSDLGIYGIGNSIYFPVEALDELIELLNTVKQLGL